ncbi:MAG: Capsule synthesis protein, CapA [Candidatus Gottesmanbacteria bacterium GW2011_GWA1_43_11]|uniref:Capsule synthesis protein, CapA n=1 Tax=Candidatus Gottesmanbacteria bacterium GW2011_GWA1_43_11 TaxID=1618436 RepID=A0A0G1CJW2_9BACT|nr:MAG: Capsule synthesis protein, CapA [Candidatus Gottesmanbacteria bacterium GW2011_GWA1_43_11]
MKHSVFWLCIVVPLFIIGLGSLAYYLLQNLQPVPASVPPAFVQPTIPVAGFPLPSSQTWTLLITGDVIPARVVNQKMVTKNDFRWPLVNFYSILQNADITLINLESPLLINCPITNEGMQFCGDARFAASLAEVGVDVANLANNHALNYGWEGLGETQELLKKVGIVTTGFASTVIPTEVEESNSPTIQNLNALDPSTNARDDFFHCERDIYCSSFIQKEVNGITIGFLGYNAVGQRVDRKIIQKQMSAADKLVDVLIVSVHWGKEYSREPAIDSIAVDDPQELGRLFVDWGADVVVGNHPHWYQHIEWVDNKPIFYALGNFIFDQEWSQETKVGYLAKLQFAGSEVVKNKLEIIPIGIKDYGQAFKLEGEEKDKVLEIIVN